ncbi:hypothetical protein QBC35DRAFT_483305 [Podospora australis]|uniref:Uncharacterized protein n=1 Tax=Podospora australis TaxID=1536484 RepID=A0AAN6X7I5_9PEZI|nr:hypothetical protein QBC35DRAFT_483305 [Podospora australis]
MKSNFLTLLAFIFLVLIPRVAIYLSKRLIKALFPFATCTNMYALSPFQMVTPTPMGYHAMQAPSCAPIKA